MQKPPHLRRHTQISITRDRHQRCTQFFGHWNYTLEDRVSLTITGSGQTDSEVKEGYITVEDCSLTVDFTADNTAPCDGETIQFTSTVSGLNGEVLAYYPLTNDLNDQTGLNGAANLLGDPPPSAPTANSPVCLNGIRRNLPGGQEFRTPVIADFDPTKFSVSVEFKVNDYGQPWEPQGVGNPITRDSFFSPPHFSFRNIPKRRETRPNDSFRVKVTELINSPFSTQLPKRRVTT